MRFSQIILWLCLILLAAPAFGQSVVLRPDDVLPRLKEAAPGAFYINGHDVHGMTEEMAQAYYPLGDSAKYVLALVTLRLADKGAISLDEPVAKALPNLMNFNPFEVAITPKHLLAETAGFAKPAGWAHEKFANAPLEYYLVKARGAGQVSEDDPIGWRLLQALLEARTGRSIDDIVVEELLVPLGFDAADLGLPRHHFRRVQNVPLEVAGMRGEAVAHLLRLLIVNEDVSGAPFLTPASHSLLVSRPLWQMHPLGIASLAGTRRMQRGRQQWIDVGTEQSGSCSFGIYAMAFPEAGVVYAKTRRQADYGTRCTASRFSNAVLTNAAANIPIRWDRQAAVEQAQELIDPEVPGGRYQCANVSAWVKDRVEGSATCTLWARPDGTDTLKVDVKWPPLTDFAAGPPLSQRYEKEAPFAYRGSLAEPPLIFSPYRAGGYAYIGDLAYVRVGVLGYFRTVATRYVPILLAILLSGALHIGSKTSVQWRRFGWFCLSGAALVGVGLYADWHWWPTVLYQLQMPWVITLWRTGLNVGLMLLLALPMLSFTFIRQQNMPEKGFALLFAGPHLGLISLSAIGLFLTTIIWGVAGTFTAY